MSSNGNISGSSPYVRPKFKAKFGNNPSDTVDQSRNVDDKQRKRSQSLLQLQVTPVRTASERLDAWQESRVSPDGSVLPAGYSRPLTRKNLLLATQLAPATFMDLMLLYWNAAGFSLFIFLTGNVINGILPAWHSLTLANLLDAVQDTLASDGPVDRRHIVKLAVLNLVTAHAETILRWLLSSNSQYVRTSVDERIEYLYLRSQLTLDFPTLSNPRVAPLLKEAAGFAGFEDLISSAGQSMKSPSRQMASLMDVMKAIVSLISGGTIMLTTVLGATQGSLSLSSVTFIVMSFLPSVLSLIAAVDHRWPPFIGAHLTKREVHELGRNGQYKQEILLFGLADWVMDKWRTSNELSKENYAYFNQSGLKVGVGMVRDSVETVCYALIALGLFPASVSMGSMRLCQSCADSLVNTVKSINYQMEELAHYVFAGTAFLESMRIDETLLEKKNGNLIDYQPQNHLGGRRGMRIEAKNMSFTYPGATEPTLKNINLTIEPGETLAIVGFNGGGKTTLVKVLMGLYENEGTLLINGIPISNYSRASLYAHTTVCFQDYAKYNLTFRENVGTGNYPRMTDPDLMTDAIRKGGADAVVAKLPRGIEEELDKFWVPPGDDAAIAHTKSPIGPVPANMPLPPPPPPERLGGCPPPGPPPPGPPGMGMGPIPRGRLGRRMARMKMREAKSLSGGQWQRVALARAFMRSEEADLVVFDEPSASLDAKAEHELFERIHALSLSESGEKIRTTVYVSHRFSTTRRADKIAVVEEGTIKELGSHDELMKIPDGRYAEFFNLQAKAFMD